MSSLSAQVTSGGRLYYIMDEGSRISILLPSKWNLIARDAFNGIVLWKKPIEKWSEHMWPLKSGPTQLTRRLVADGDRIFVTMGIGEPISVIDGATGKVIRTFPETKGAEEILHVGGVIYALVNPADWALKDFAPKLQSDQERVAQEYEWDKKPRTLMAVDANTGAVLWKKEQTKVTPITLSDRRQARGLLRWRAARLPRPEDRRAEVGQRSRGEAHAARIQLRSARAPHRRDGALRGRRRLREGPRRGDRQGAVEGAA